MYPDSIFLAELKKLLSDPSTYDRVYQLIMDNKERDRQERRKLQAEGIRLARERGVLIGRPRKQLPANFSKVAELVGEKRINITEAAKMCGMSRTSFYKLYRKINMS